MYNVNYYNDLSNKVLSESVWKILCECDREFIPHLSARESSYQGVLNDIKNTHSKPISYFNAMKQQKFIICKECNTNEIVAFMTFKRNYNCDEMSISNKSNYITTICVTKNHRNKGILKLLYNYIEYKLPKEVRLNYLTTRTWSTNTWHIHTLKKNGYKIINTLVNHRGENIDTIYFAKSILNGGLL